MTEQLEIGPRKPRHGPPWWLLVVAVVIVVGVVGYGVRAHTHKDRAGSHPSNSPTPSTHSTTAPTPGRQPTTPSPSGSPTVRRLGHALLPGMRSGWQLFARTGQGLIRLDLARGRITHTPVPGFGSGGPVSFLAGPQRVLIRPLDNVAGFVIPDGKPAHELTGALSHGGPALPGPKPDQTWVQGNRQLRLARLDGTPLGSKIRFPKKANYFPTADGRGYPLVDVPHHGSYEIRPGRGPRRITTGQVVAVGPSRWLVKPENPDNRCRYQVIDQRTDHRRCLNPKSQLKLPSHAYGMISPDGHTAALARGTGVTTTLQFLDLADGADQTFDVSIPGQIGLIPGSGRLGNGEVVWSPDSTWLFVINSHHHLVAINRHTAHQHTFGPVISSLEIQQLAFRDNSS